MNANLENAVSDVTIHKSVACTLCGCVCDDLQILTSRNEIIQIDKACDMANRWFSKLTSQSLSSQQETRATSTKVVGKPATLEAGLEEAVRLISVCKYPLIYGLSRSTTEGQRQAIALAEFVGATIDTTASTGHAQSLIAMQRVGESTCSLGEVKNRADLVIYWASDPLKTHPRHIERYVLAPGLFRSPHEKKPKIIVVDNKENQTKLMANQFISIPESRDWEILQILKAKLKGISINKPAWLTDSLDQKLSELIAEMKSCQFGIIFFGSELTQRGHGHRNVEAILSLTSRLNQFTRFYAKRMRRLGDVAGADSVLTWQSGFPFAVNYSRGYPRYQPGEFSAMKMLERREIDLAILIGSDSIRDFSEVSLAWLKKIPLITLNASEMDHDIPGLISPQVSFSTAIYGIHERGTAYRMDEIPIPLRQVVTSSLPTDDFILRSLLDLLKKNCS